MWHGFSVANGGTIVVGRSPISRLSAKTTASEGTGTAGNRDAMHSHLINRAITTVLVLLATASVIAAPVIVENREAHAVKLAAVQEHSAMIRVLADRDDAAGLALMLEQIDSDENIDPAVRDHLLEAALLAMSATTPAPTARAAVSYYRNRPVSAFVRLQEERGQQVVPLYDLAAAAAMTMRIWDTAAAEDLVSTALRAAQWQPIDFLQPSQGMSLEAWQVGTRRAFESVDRRSIAATKSALLQSQSLSDEYDPLLLVAATRMGDTDLYYAIIRQGNAHYGREAIASVYRSLSSGDAVNLLINASARPELASAAILELGAHFSSENEVRHWLLSRLGDPADGASAALALARAADDEILSEIRAVILGDATELMKLRAALVLRISESAAAQSLRHELLSQKLASEKLQEALK